MDSIIQYLINSLKEEEIYRNNRIPHKESYILRLVTLGCLTNKTLKVSDQLKNQDLGSGPTIQSYITKLVLHGLVARNISEEDKRIQYLIPTENAINVFSELSRTVYGERISRS